MCRRPLTGQNGRDFVYGSGGLTNHHGVGRDSFYSPAGVAAPGTPGTTTYGGAAYTNKPDSVGRLPAQQGRYGNFYETPGYQFRYDEQMRGVNAAASAGGYLESGRHLKDAMSYSGGLASQEYGNYFSRLQSAAGMGQTATNQGVAAGQNFASGSANIYGAEGAQRASSLTAQGNSQSNYINSLFKIGGAVAGFF